MAMPRRKIYFPERESPLTRELRAPKMGNHGILGDRNRTALTNTATSIAERVIHRTRISAVRGDFRTVAFRGRG